MNVLKILSPLMPEGLFSLLSAGCECKTLHPRLDRVNRDQRTAGLKVTRNLFLVHGWLRLAKNFGQPPMTTFRVSDK
jgi:hypothetical protein